VERFERKLAKYSRKLKMKKKGEDQWYRALLVAQLGLGHSFVDQIDIEQRKLQV
jgi:hypothetical protein